MERNADILIVGGSLGGCAAAMSAASLGARVLLTEKLPWIGGQLTSQAVPPDEHPWIEQFGCTARYRHLRHLIRDYYRAHYPLTPQARFDHELNPGNGWVSKLCHEPRVALAALEQMMAFPLATGRLEVMTGWTPIAVDVENERIRSVLFEDASGMRMNVSAALFLDATEFGDLLPLAGVEYVVGAESKSDTGEPHALDGPAQPDRVEPISHCFALSHEPGEDHTIARPAHYDRWRDYQPRTTPPWPGKLLGWSVPSQKGGASQTCVLFPWESAQVTNSSPVRVLFTYRRILAAEHFPQALAPSEITLVNWPQNDYWEGKVIDQPSEVTKRSLEEARELSLSLLYWLQTDAPRPDGGIGYPSLRLRPDVVGTVDGLAMHPYVRESRRIRALFPLTENHVGTEARGGRPAESFDDSIGVASYAIDLHPSTAGSEFALDTQPFELPLGMLIPVRVKNLLPACKNAGATHLTSGCVRVHHAEWSIGEAAGVLAAISLHHKVYPVTVYKRDKLSAEFLGLLDAQGVERHWPSLSPRH